MGLNAFDRVAPFYDTLKGLVFGSAIRKSQFHFIGSLQKDGEFLIIGGGSGEILPLLGKLHPGSTIWYVEASSRMLKMAAKRVLPGGPVNVKLIHGTEASIPPDLLFDAVITNFFLDLFPAVKLEPFSRMVQSRLKHGGVWLVTDFVDQRRWWQAMLLKGMYAFFFLTCGIEARKLPPWENTLRSSGMIASDSKSFYRGFIKSSMYIKPV